MRGHLVSVVAVALLLAASCGGDGDSSLPVADPTTPASTSTTTETTAPATTSAPTVTTVEPPAMEMAVLRPDGLGPVDFGTLAEEAITELTDLLGAPDRVERIGPEGECVEGASWLDCIRDLRVVESGQLAVWDVYGLEVALVDTARDAWPQEQAPLQFGDWHTTIAPSGSRLVTAEGVSPVMTVGELRTAVPWVEFTYNEGLLDSYYIAVGAGGGYWGRLDWDPTTTDIDWHDIAAMQAALNGQGAELEEDGVWGPASKAAWLALLSDHGIKATAPTAEWPVWLTPDIGRTLGLPPDDIIVASLEPDPVTEATTSPLQLPILRVDGLAGYDFGEPANKLVDELSSMLGPPSQDTSHTPDGVGSFDFLPNGYWAAHELRVVDWNQPDLHIVLSDIPWTSDGFGEATPGTLTLVRWETVSPRFTVDDQLAVGSSQAELRALYPNVQIGTFDVCETEYEPAAFVTTSYDGQTPPLWRGLRGATDWDWVSDLQTALNERGASLAVDGEYGPKTSAAVAALEQETGVVPVGGDVDSEIVEVLGLEPPSNACITRLGAGYPGSC